MPAWWCTWRSSSSVPVTRVPHQSRGRPQRLRGHRRFAAHLSGLHLVGRRLRRHRTTRPRSPRTSGPVALAEHYYPSRRPLRGDAGRGHRRIGAAGLCSSAPYRRRPEAPALADAMPWNHGPGLVRTAVRAVLVVPDPGIPLQLAHHDDVAAAIALAATTSAPPGAYNIAGRRRGDGLRRRVGFRRPCGSGCRTWRPRRPRHCWRTSRSSGTGGVGAHDAGADGDGHHQGQDAAGVDAVHDGPDLDALARSRTHSLTLDIGTRRCDPGQVSSVLSMTPTGWFGGLAG